MPSVGQQSRPLAARHPQPGQAGVSVGALSLARATRLSPSQPPRWKTTTSSGGRASAKASWFRLQPGARRRRRRRRPLKVPAGGHLTGLSSAGLELGAHRRKRRHAPQQGGVGGGRRWHPAPAGPQPAGGGRRQPARGSAPAAGGDGVRRPLRRCGPGARPWRAGLPLPQRFSISPAPAASAGACRWRSSSRRPPPDGRWAAPAEQALPGRGEAPTSPSLALEIASRWPHEGRRAPADAAPAPPLRAVGRQGDEPHDPGDLVRLAAARHHRSAAATAAAARRLRRPAGGTACRSGGGRWPWSADQIEHLRPSARWLEGVELHAQHALLVVVVPRFDVGEAAAGGQPVGAAEAAAVLHPQPVKASGGFRRPGR